MEGVNPVEAKVMRPGANVSSRALGVRLERTTSRPKSLGPFVGTPLQKSESSPVIPKSTATLPARARALFAQQESPSQISRSKFYVTEDVADEALPTKPFAELPLLDGETIQGYPFPNVTYMCPYNGPLNGELVITNYRVYFTCYDQDFPLKIDVPLGGIKKIEKCGKAGSRGEHSYGIDLFCADMRNLRFACQREHGARRSLFETLQRFAFPKSHKHDVFAFDYCATFPVNGWEVYDAGAEYERMGIPSKWAFSSLNENYDLCDTYPRVLVIPAGAPEEEVRAVASFRSRKRIPVLSWIDPDGRASITRCSQPLVGVGGKRSKIDEKYVLRIRDANSTSGRLAIMDARPPVNAKANKARGGGYENEENYPFADVIFLDIHNIHVMRESLRKVKDMVFPDVDHNRWYSNLASSSWLEHVKTVIAGAVRIVERIYRVRESCLVHCSDGWDRTAQLTALSMLLLDPYYRTLVGFEVLIEKEWLSFGHKFAQRVGHGDDRHGDGDRSPIFVQFIDCVWQISTQFPYAFEFNEDFLIFILDHLYSCRFGTFLCNSEKERSMQDLKTKTVSIWSYVNSRRGQFLNPFFFPIHRQPRVLVPVANSRHIKLWEGYYCRWNSIFNEPVGVDENPAEIRLVARPVALIFYAMLQRATAASIADLQGLRSELATELALRVRLRRTQAADDSDEDDPKNELSDSSLLI